MSDATSGDGDIADQLKAGPVVHPRRHRRAAAVFVVLTLVAVSAAIPGVWARRTLLNTDRYVATVDELASQPAIQEAIATEITVAVFDALDVQQRLATVIGERAPKLVFLAGPVSDAVEGFVQDQVLKVVQSQAFATFWSEANRFVHEQALALLRGDDQAVQIQGDQVVLYYLPLLNQALGGLSDVLTDLLGKPITLPTITQDTLPAQAIPALETALGIDLPDTFGQVVLVQGDALSSVQQGFRAANALAILLVVAILAFATLALVVSPAKRRTLLQLAVGILAVTVIERRLSIIGVNGIVADTATQFQAAAREVADVLLDSLLSSTLWIIIAMAVVIAAAVLSGPYPWVVSFRSWAGDVAQGTAGAVRTADASPAAAWVGAHREGLMIGVAVVAAAIWLFAEVSFGGFLLLLIVAGVVELVISRAGPASGDETS